MKRVRSKSLFPGVTRACKSTGWQAHRRGRYLGTYDTREEAYAAYCQELEREKQEKAKESGQEALLGRAI